MKTIKELVRNSVAKFSYAISGVLYYDLYVDDEIYQFPIDMNDKNDVGTTAFLNEYRGITLMRYIRKAIENESLIKIK